MSAALQAGAARRAITPAVGACLYGYRPNWKSESVHDDLHVTALTLRFGTEDDHRAFLAKVSGTWTPADTGKHIYTNWTQIMEKRGALHPSLDPFRMKENEGLQTDYSPDICTATLDLLARTAYISVDPDWDDAAIKDRAAAIRAALR